MSDENKVTTISIRDIIAVLFRRKWLVILPIILATAIAFGGSFLMEERYKSSTMVVTDQTQFLSKQLQAFVPGQEDQRFSQMQMTSRLIAIHNEIISSAYLTRLIDEMHLNEDPDIIKKATKAHNKHPEISLERMINHILITDLRDNIDVNFNGEDIIEITAESDDPTRAMNIATKLAEIFKDERLKRELSGVRGALDFSDEQLAIYRKNLDDAESRKANFEAEVIRNKLDESISADKNIRSIVADVDNIKLLLDENIDDQIKVRSALTEFSKDQLKLDFSSEYRDVKNSIAEETQRLANFMSRYPWSDPKVLSANLKISNYENQLENIIGDLVDDQYAKATNDERTKVKEFFRLQAREMVLRQKSNDFEVSLSTLRNRISKQPQYEIELRNLENEVASARQIYEKFHDQLTGSEISQSLMRGEAESKYRIMEPASVPLSPVKPNRTKISVMGLILGIVIGGAAALMAELLDSSFKKVEEVEEYLDLPVLATIPVIPSIKGKVKTA